MASPITRSLRPAAGLGRVYVGITEVRAARMAPAQVEVSAVGGRAQAEHGYGAPVM